MADELKLKINVEMVGGDKAVSNLDKINERIEKATNLSNDLAKAFSAFKEMTKGLDTLASATKTFSSAFKDVSGTTKTSVSSFEKLSKTLNSLEQNQAKLKIQEEKLNQEKLKTITLANREIASYEKTVGAMARTEAQLSRLGVQEARAAAQMDKLSNSTKSAKTNINIANNSLSVFIGNLASSSFSRLTNQMWDFAKSCSRAGIELDALKNTFMAATGGWTQGGEEMNWLISVSNKLGLNFGEISDSYAKFMTSFTRSGGTIEQSRQIFEDLSTAMVNLHLPAERMQGVFVALEQMANKGTVQAEELKKQLGNALPAAFEIGAESMGILPKQLMDMMKKGEVFSKDFLPNFAKSVKENLGQGIDIASNQFNASLGRLNTAISLFKMEIGQGLNEALKPLIDLAIPLVNSLANLAKFFNENVVASALLKSALLGLTAAALPSVISSIAQVSISLKNMIPILGAINISLGGLPLVIGACVAGVTALGLTLSDASKKASDITPYLGLREQIVELTKSVTELDLSTQEGQIDLEKYKQEFPELTNYLIENKKSLAELTDAEFEQIAALGKMDKEMQVVRDAEAQLNSWQLKTAATFRVAWRNIAETVKSACKSMIDDWNRWQKTRNQERITNLEETIKKEQDVINKMRGGTSSDPLFAQGSFKEQTYYAYKDALKKHEEELKKLKGINEQKEKGAKLDDKLGKAGFAGEVEVEMRAMLGISNKLDEITKSSEATVRGLKNAKSAYIGLEKATSDKKSKKGKTGAKGYQKTEAEKDFDKLKHEKSALEAKSATGGLTDAERARYKELTSLINGNKVALKELTMSESEIFDLKQKKISQLENEIKLGLYQGQNVEALVADYNLEKLKMEEVNDAFNQLTGDLQDGWKREEAQLKRLRAEYKYMVTHVNEFTDAEIKQAQATLKSQEALSAYAKTMAELEKPAEITKRHAKDLGKNLVDGLLDVVDGSKTFWEAFAEIGKTTLKNYASDMMKNFLDKAVASFAYGNATGGIKGGLGTMFSSIFGMGINKDSEDGGGGLFSSLIKDAEGLSTVLNETTGSALSGTIEQLSFVKEGADIAGLSFNSLSAPITSVATNMISMASSMPMAAMCMGSLSATMKVAAPIFQQAAPAITQMASAMSQLATSSANAATSMAALAVSTAAESVAKIPYVGGFLAPVAAALTGAAIAAGTIMTGAGIAASSAMAGIGQGFGSAASGAGQGIGGFASKVGGGNVIPHAKGGVVSSPTTFPMSGGSIGLAGEAGTEVIAPARRMSNGELGVGAVQPKVTVNNYTNAAVEVIKRPDNEMEIKINELNAMLSSSRTNKGMASAQSRMSSRGKRIG